MKRARIWPISYWGRDSTSAPEIVLANDNSSLHTIFGSPDDLKFRSSMTLFSRAADDADNPFRQALDRWCDGRPDEQTLALID